MQDAQLELHVSIVLLPIGSDSPIAVLELGILFDVDYIPQPMYPNRKVLTRRTECVEEALAKVIEFNFNRNGTVENNYQSGDSDTSNRSDTSSDTDDSH